MPVAGNERVVNDEASDLTVVLRELMDLLRANNLVEHSAKGGAIDITQEESELCCELVIALRRSDLAR